MGRRSHIRRAVRRNVELMDLNVERDQDEKLESASKEEMVEWHELRIYRKGSAGMGVGINGTLGLVISATNLAAAANNARQGYVAHREQKKIEKAAKEHYGADFRKEISRKRHLAAGAEFKLTMSVATGFQDDLFMAGFTACEAVVGGLDLGIDHNQAAMAALLASIAASAGWGYLGGAARTKIIRNKHYNVTGTGSV